MQQQPTVDDYQMGLEEFRLDLMVAIAAGDSARYIDLTNGLRGTPTWEQIEKLLELGMRPRRLAEKIAHKPRQTKVPPTPAGGHYRASTGGKS